MAGDESDIRFGQIAISRGFITADQLQECVDIQKGRATRLGELLVTAGYMTGDHAEQVAQSQKLAAGEPVRLGKYEIIEKIGEGGMGSVYKARDVEAGEPDRSLVALKILPPKLARDSIFIERFRREGKNAGALNHPNLVAGYDLGLVDGFHFIAMEYVEGRNVWWLFKRKGVFEEEVVLRIGYDICLALDHAASHGLVHRDLKPENIMITTDGHAKLLDLGLARSFEQGADRLTKRGIAIGTPQYISPEQARGSRDVDMRSDIYSLGATLYHLLTGREPFDGPTAPVIMTKHLNEPVVWPGDVRAEISENASRILVRMMAKDKRDRYQTPRLAAEDMARALHGRPIDELPRNAKWFKRARPGRKRADDSTRPPAAGRRNGRAAAGAGKKAQGAGAPGRILDAIRPALRRGREIWDTWPMRIRVAGVAGVVMLLLVPVLIEYLSRAPRLIRPIVNEVAEDEPRAPLREPTASAPPDAMARAKSEHADLPTLDRAPRAPADEERAHEAYEGIQRLERAGKTSREELIGRYATLVQIFGDTESGRWAAERLGELKRTGRALHASAVPAPPSPRVSVDETAPRGFAPYARVVDEGAAWQQLPLTIQGPRRYWKSYGAWKRTASQGLSFRFNPSNKYARAIMSRRPVGPSEILVEFRHQGGEHVNVALMDKAGEHVLVSAGGETLGLSGRWRRLYLRAGKSDMAAYLDQVRLKPVRDGNPREGAIRLSLVGGSWEIRAVYFRPLASPEAALTVPLYLADFDADASPRWHAIPVRRDGAHGRSAVKAHKSSSKDYAVFARVSARPGSLFSLGHRSHIQFEYFLDARGADASEAPLWVWVAVRGRESAPYVYRVDPATIVGGRWSRVTCRLSSFRASEVGADGLVPGAEISAFGVTAGKPGSSIDLLIDNVAVYDVPGAGKRPGDGSSK